MPEAGSDGLFRALGTALAGSEDKIMTLGHIAIYTEDTEKSVKFYEALGGKVSMSGTLNLGGGKTKKLTHIKFDTETTVELMEVSDKSATPAYGATGIIEHFCFNVDDVDKAVEELKKRGIDSFKDPEPKDMPEIFGKGYRRIFLIGPSGEQIELFQLYK